MADGNKKHGTTKRKPAQMRYTAARRWETNKKRRVITERAKQARAQTRRMKRIAAGKRVRKNKGAKS